MAGQHLTFHRVLHKPPVLNMPGSEYGKVVNKRGLHSVLNMPE